jgi:hypothetical protein
MASTIATIVAKRALKNNVVPNINGTVSGSWHLIQNHAGSDYYIEPI